MEQFWYTDNLRGNGLSVLRSSEGLTRDLLAAIDAYCGYLRSSDGCNGDGQRYNLSFAGEGFPVLMNSAYLGKEVTTQRNGNFLTHAVLSKYPLKGYAADYFLREGFFCRTLLQDEARSREELRPLEPLDDVGERDGKGESDEENKKAAEIVNARIEFYRNLLQATLFTLKNGGHIRLFEFGNAQGDEQAIQIVWALTHLLPVNVANRITFNTRANAYEPPRDRYMVAFQKGEERRAMLGSAEILQFYDSSRSSCGTEGCNYYFYRNNGASSTRFGKTLPFVDALLPASGTSAELIGKVENWFKESGLDAEEHTREAIESITGEKWDFPLIIPKKAETNDKTQVPQEKQRAEKRGKNDSKKRKALILSALICVFLAAEIGLTVFFAIGKEKVNDPTEKPPSGQIDPPSESEYFTVVYPGGEIARFRIGDEIVLDLPDARLGYDFLGYRDGKGDLLTDGSGAVKKEYSFVADSRLELSCIWQPRKNTLTVSYAEGQEFTFTCATDEEILFPAELLPALENAYPHMRITGFQLGSSKKEKICTLSGDSVVWETGYQVFSEAKYREQLESGKPLVLVPVTEYRSYPVKFYDYATKEQLGSKEIAYDQPISVDKSYTEKYFGGKYYLYLKQGAEFIKVYNVDGSDRWEDGYDSVSGYDAVLDTAGEISLYVSGNARLRIGNTQKDVELGTDIFALCESMTSREEIDSVNLIYIGNDRSRSVSSDEAFWQIVGALDLKNSINVIPAYRSTFTFGYGIGKTELMKGNAILKRSVIYLHFSSGDYLYEGNEMSEIVDALKEKAPDIHTPNNIVCADLIENLWIPVPSSTDSSYKVFEDRVLEYGMRMASYFTEDGRYRGNAAALVAEEQERCLYAVYDPRTVTVTFQGSTGAPYTTSYGGEFKWSEMNGRINYTPQWGTYLVGWSAADGKLKENGEDAVTKSMLDDFGAAQKNGSSLSIEFVPLSGNYQFRFSIRYGGREMSNRSFTVNETVTFDKTKIEQTFPVALYSTAWNQGWTIGGQAFTPAESMIVNEGNFGRYVNFGSANDHSVTLTAAKEDPAPRQYTVRTDSEAYYLRRGNSPSPLNQTLQEKATGSIVYSNRPISLGVCKKITKSTFLGDSTEYVFDGWFVGNTRITNSDGIILDFAALYELATNGILEVRAVFKEDTQQSWVRS